MHILVACEESQVVTKAFRANGHNAYSCDLQPCSGGHPEWHLQLDVRAALHNGWDLIIAFPPCTHLAVSGATWFPEKIADGRQERAVQVFFSFLAARCDKICVENPVGIMSTRLKRRPDQIIQPWQFGHGEKKATCLWLKGLPKLEPTKIVEGREDRVWRMGSHKGNTERSKLRSRTYIGIAKAMADQWGGTQNTEAVV